MHKVLSLGQCAADHASISGHLRNELAVEVMPADTFDEAIAAMRAGPVALVLVNRILDATGEAGLEFIRQLKADSTFADTPVMMASNFEKAQQEAVAAGALPGFGKAALGSPEVVANLRSALKTK